MEDKKTKSAELNNKKFVDAGPSVLANKPNEPPLKVQLSVNKVLSAEVRSIEKL